MTSVRLRDDVFMAEADGLLIFLDLSADRYFALNAAFSAELAPVLKRGGEDADDDQLRRLRRAGALQMDGPGKLFAATAAVSPARDLRAVGADPLSAVRASLCRWRAERDLATKHIASIVEQRRTRRQVARVRAPSAVETRAATFAASRALRGGRDACLKEALALLYFLGDGAPGVDWVFAVKGAPFAAHCWVQAGDLVLNDSVDNVSAYTPIMVA